MSARPVIIGAGPMGLAAAMVLARRGHKPLLLEADDRVGGMSASFDFDGRIIERYYHFINLPDENLFNLLQDLGMRDTLRWRSTKMGFFRPDASGRGTLYSWGNPFALLAFPGVSLLTRLRYGAHAFRCKFYQNLDPLDDISVADWIRKWEGRQGYDILWRFLFEKKFFELADPLSAAWIASRVRRVANSRKSLMEESLGYLEGGSHRLMERLVEEIHVHGGEVRLNAPVQEIECRQGHVYGVRTEGESLPASRVISTIPLPILAGIASALPDAYAHKLRQIRNIGCRCALFRLKRPLTGCFWVNVDLPGLDLPGIIEYSNLNPSSHAYIYVPFYMPQTHPNWVAPDHALLAMARSALQRINPEAAATEEAARIFRYNYAQPVCPPGFRHVLPPYETGIDGLLAADTTHSFPEDRSINESVRIGKELAERLPGAEN